MRSQEWRIHCWKKIYLFLHSTRTKNYIYHKRYLTCDWQDSRYINVTAGHLKTYVVYDESKMTSSTARPGLTAFLDWIPEKMKTTSQQSVTAILLITILRIIGTFITTKKWSNNKERLENSSQSCPIYTNWYGSKLQTVSSNQSARYMEIFFKAI